MWRWQYGCVVLPVEKMFRGYPDTMDDTGKHRTGDEPTVPGVGGPGGQESAADGQSGLRLHAGIAAVATVLCAFVTWVFLRLGSWPLAVVFAVIGLASLGALEWAISHQRRGKRLRRLRTG